MTFPRTPVAFETLKQVMKHCSKAVEGTKHCKFVKEPLIYVELWDKGSDVRQTRFEDLQNVRNTWLLVMWRTALLLRLKDIISIPTCSLCRSCSQRYLISSGCVRLTTSSTTCYWQRMNTRSFTSGTQVYLPFKVSRPWLKTTLFLTRV